MYIISLFLPHLIKVIFLSHFFLYWFISFIYMTDKTRENYYISIIEKTFIDFFVTKVVTLETVCF